MCPVELDENFWTSVVGSIARVIQAVCAGLRTAGVREVGVVNGEVKEM